MTEIAYSILYSDNCLLIHLSELSGGIITPLQTAISTAQWTTLASHKYDKEIMTTLIKNEKNGKTFLKFHIPSNQAIPVLELLGSTQKLYFNQKQLVVDLYGGAELYYESSNKEGVISVKGRLKWREKDIPVTNCLCIGPGKPNWFIHGILLKGISTHINWKRLLQLYENSPLVLEGAQKAAFLDEIDPEDPDSPKIIGSSIENASSLFPILILKDRSGAFADLWMDYGNGEKVLFQDPRNSLNKLKRQPETERNWEKDLLETDFICKQTGTSHYYCPTDKVAKSLTFLIEIGWSILDWKGNRVIKQESSQLNMEESHNAILVKGKVKFAEFEADVVNVLGAFNRRERFVTLSDNTVGLLSIDHEAALQELAEEGEIIGESIKVKKSHFGSLSNLFEQSSLTSSLSIFKEKIQHFSGIQEACPSTQFSGQLRPYQQQGLNWLTFLHDYGLHGILADDMGLGKTVQVLALLSKLETKQPHLIVMPTSLLFNWKNEIHTFLPGIKCYVHQGPARTKSVAELQAYPIILTSYTTLRLDAPLLQQLEYHCIILDEAQMIKNPQTQTAQTVYQLKGKLRLCITGTPIENRLSDLWSLFQFLMPDLLDSLESFESDVAAASVDRRHLDRIKRKIAPFILRRTKQEVLKDLPPRIDQVVWIEMSEEQRGIYERFLSGVKNNLIKKVEVEGMGKHRLEIFEAILRLRQICCHPLLVSSLLDENVVPSSAKFEALEADLETLVAEGRKALVYSQFTSMLKLMTQLAKSRGWSYSYLDGSTTNREKVVDDFQNDPNQSLFFVSLKAGGVGLNLTAADYVYLYDPWWNEAVEEQAINRAHRIGREDVVIAKRLVIAESIEEKMMKLKAMKRLAIEEILDTDSSPSDLTVEDLKFLLGS